MRLVSFSAVGLLLWIGCALAAGQEHIGSWVLSCPGDGPTCLLRLDKRFLDKAGVTGDLEIHARGKALVPVLALRGLPAEVLIAASMAGQTEASVQFLGGPRQDLVCAPSGGAYVCSPQDNAVATLAAGLPGARSVTVRVSVTVSGLKPLAVQEKSVELTGTGEALARLRAAGSLGAPAPMASGRLTTMADKVLKAAGYPNGVADLEGLLAKYRGK
jgi:hypothetical protein